MFVFGGRDRVGNFQDLYCFNFDSRVWRRVETSGVDGRFFSSLSVLEEQMFIFGGRNIHSFAFNDVLRASVAVSCGATERRASLLQQLGSPEFADVVFAAPDDPIGDDAERSVVASQLASCGTRFVLGSDLASARLVFAHRAVVCGRCPVLATMLSSDMRESRTGVVAMRGVTARQIRALLGYLYTDQVLVEKDEGEEDVLALLALSNQWQLSHLKVLCQQHMSSFVSLQNVTRFLLAAHQLDAPLLFASCRAFVAKHERLLDVAALPAHLQASVAAVSSPPRQRRLE